MFQIAGSQLFKGRVAEHSDQTAVRHENPAIGCRAIDAKRNVLKKIVVTLFALLERLFRTLTFSYVNCDAAQVQSSGGVFERELEREPVVKSFVRRWDCLNS